MTNTSPRSTNKMSGLGCYGPVAGWNPRKERATQQFDKAVKKAEAQIPLSDRKNKQKPFISLVHRIAAE